MTPMPRAPAPPPAKRARTAPLACALALALTATVPGTARAADPAPAPLTPITTLDLPRYMGTWYELARYPNRFQRDCRGPAMATYSLEPEGRVKVVNRCPQADGKTDEAIGEARRLGQAGSARLQVRFAPAWLAWLPMVWGDYWVIDLDPAYQVSVVSEPRREYLWVLSRTPTVEPAVWQAVTTRLQGLGFDLQRLKRAGAAD